MTIYYWSGKPLFVSGEIAIDSGCCCDTECDLCDDTGAYGSSGDKDVIYQDSIHVTRSGTCDSACSGAEGYYYFSEKINTDAGCNFRFYEEEDLPDGIEPLDIEVTGSGVYGYLLYGDQCLVAERDLITATCDSSTGKITVTGSLDGRNAEGTECANYQCSGCTFYLSTSGA